MKLITNLFSKNKKNENHEFDSRDMNNADEAIIRAINSVKLLTEKIEDLTSELKQTNFEHMSEIERNIINKDINGKIQVIERYIFVLHSLALNIVNNPKYKENEKGSFLNLNFLTILNRIKEKRLINNRNISEKLLISQLCEIKSLLEEIKFN